MPVRVSPLSHFSSSSFFFPLIFRLRYSNLLCIFDQLAAGARTTHSSGHIRRPVEKRVFFNHSTQSRDPLTNHPLHTSPLDRFRPAGVTRYPLVWKHKSPASHSHSVRLLLLSHYWQARFQPENWRPARRGTQQYLKLSKSLVWDTHWLNERT